MPDFRTAMFTWDEDQVRAALPYNLSIILYPLIVNLMTYLTYASFSLSSPSFVQPISKGTSLREYSDYWIQDFYASSPHHIRKLYHHLSIFQGRKSIFIINKKTSNFSCFYFIFWSNCNSCARLWCQRVLIIRTWSRYNFHSFGYKVDIKMINIIGCCFHKVNQLAFASSAKPNSKPYLSVGFHIHFMFRHCCGYPGEAIGVTGKQFEFGRLDHDVRHTKNTKMHTFWLNLYKVLFSIWKVIAYDAQNNKIKIVWSREWT